MSVVDVENLRLHYARTLGALERAVRRRDGTASARAYGEEFRRAWELYLAGSEAAFATGWMQLFQVVFAPRESAPPFWTRADALQRPRGRPTGMIRCDALVVGGGPGRLDVRAHAAQRRLGRRRPRSRAVSARQGLRRLADARRLPAARSRRRPNTAPAALTLQEITGFRTRGDRRRRRSRPATRDHQLRHPPVRVRRLPAPPRGRARAREHAARVAPPRTATLDRQRAHRRAGRRRRRRPLLPGRAAPARRRRHVARPVVAQGSGVPPGRRPRRGAPAQLPELFFCRDLEGYGWCVRKGELPQRRHRPPRATAISNQHVAGLHRRSSSTTMHIRTPARACSGAATPTSRRAPARGRSSATACCSRRRRRLAYPESGEGIRPAIESGQMAAAALIAAGGRYSAERCARTQRPWSACTRRESRAHG